MSDADHMTPDEFRIKGREVIDWIAEYMERIEELPVLSQVKPGEVRAALPEHPPEEGEPFDDVLADVERVILPGVTHWQSPNFFAFFAGNTSGPAVLGELLSAGLGVQGMLWATSPAATELETLVLDWLAEMLELPSSFRSTSSGGGVIQDSASSSTLTAVLAGRERSMEYRGNEVGVSGRLVAYASTQAHSSIEKAVRIAGIGSERFRKIEVDETYAMRPEALAEAMKRDSEDGYVPAFVNATVGTTSSLALDPVRAIGEIARQHGAWYHVDGAWAGSAAVVPELRHIQDGLELADSYVVNPHKWLLAGVDLSAFYVADRDALIRSLAILPDYLRNQASASGEVIDYRDWHVSLGRRFRALKLWFVIRHYGVSGLRAMIREHVRLGQELAGWIEEHPDFELVAPVPLNLVCFRHVKGDEKTQAIMDRINASGAAYLTHTTLDGGLVARVNVGQTYTEERHVRTLWEVIQRSAE